MGSTSIGACLTFLGLDALFSGAGEGVSGNIGGAIGSTLFLRLDFGTGLGALRIVFTPGVLTIDLRLLTAEA